MLTAWWKGHHALMLKSSNMSPSEIQCYRLRWGRGAFNPISSILIMGFLHAFEMVCGNTAIHGEAAKRLFLHLMGKSGAAVVIAYFSLKANSLHFSPEGVLGAYFQGVASSFKEKGHWIYHCRDKPQNDLMVKRSIMSPLDFYNELWQNLVESPHVSHEYVLRKVCVRTLLHSFMYNTKLYLSNRRKSPCRLLSIILRCWQMWKQRHLQESNHTRI